LGIIAVLWGCTYLFGGSLIVLSYLINGASTVLLLWNISVDQQKAGKEDTPEQTSKQAWWPYLLALAPILFWVPVTASIGGLFTAQTDNWYYLAIIRRIAHTQQIAPGDPFFLGVADPQRGGPWMAAVAVLTERSGIEPSVFWNAAPAIIIPIAVLAHYLLANTLFKDRLASGLSCLFLLYGFGRYTWDTPLVAATPAGIGFTLFLVTLSLAWHYLEERSWRALLLALLTGWALASIHLLVFAGLLAALSAYAVLHLIIHRRWEYLGRVLLLVLISTLAAIPFVHGWVGHGPQTDNPIYADEWGLLSEFRGWQIIKPSVLVGSGSSPWTWAFLLLPVLLLLCKEHTWAIFLLASMLFVLATAFNPLFVTPVLHLNLIPSWGIWRIALQVFQFQFVLGAIGATAIRWLIHKAQQEWNLPAFARTALLAVSIAAAFLPSVVPLAKPMYAYASRSLNSLENGAAARFPFSWQKTLQFLRREAPSESVILSDANTNFFISALTSHYVVSIPYGHSSPFVNDDEVRRQDTALVLDPSTDMETVLSVLDQYHVSLILLTHGTPTIGGYALSADDYARLVDRFEKDSSHFQIVFTEEIAPDRQTTLFSYTPDGNQD
jgi:hypothetical protein